jgi:hypothetical protein
MQKFQQYKSYYLNWKLVKDYRMNPVSDNPNAANKAKMSFDEMLDVIGNNQNSFTFQDHLFHIEVNVGDRLYLFEKNSISKYFVIILKILQSGGLNDFFGLMWLYIEWDFVDEVCFYIFFLCKEDNIIIPSIAISESPGLPLPNDILLENPEYFSGNGKEDSAALVRLCYEKWQKDTLPGRIYAMKLRMQRKQDFVE